MENAEKENIPSNSGVQPTFQHSPYLPFDPTIGTYFNFFLPGAAIPLEYTGWRDEVMSWKETCYLHGGLNPSNVTRFKGPDVVKFLSEHCVNSIAKFPIGTATHGMMCTEEGILISEGVLLRLAEDEFDAYMMAPYITYKAMKGNYDLEVEDLTQMFLYQVAGPRSLEVLETASGDCLHDIKFLDHRMSSINDIDVRVLRFGMAGTLAYEVHGQFKDAIPVYNAILKAGQKFGIRRLGFRAYMMNHTENGFPQSFIHYPPAPSADKEYMEYMSSFPQFAGLLYLRIEGSIGPDPELHYRTPIELGWSHVIKFDHDFVGRKALEKEKGNPHRKMVTLVWNTEDIIDVYASQFKPGEPYANMDKPSATNFVSFGYTGDKVLKDGKIVGIASGRVYSYYYRKMLSLCSIDIACSDIGTEVIVVWGNPGTRQKEIRAIVSRFPYLNENRNEDVDVSQIPCLAKKK